MFKVEKEVKEKAKIAKKDIKKALAVRNKKRKEQEAKERVV